MSRYDFYERRCINCGLPMPPLPWWQRNWLLEPPPMHDPDGPYGPLCWRGLSRRLGLPAETPMPPRSWRG